ncbi:hypothetical protein M378DRAFT_967403 [Amanita muscaria Koide BX008]|uniref:Uncharacterized protein n=1 Tax=Amanita muscaria (strain Koide BX008) TaxID=946122 RepID=A0A0C2T061_AMAMK|nr:hypothetical protein M378DRAFT_967403 [Amanita muscaria Koide BX008]
MYAWIIDFLCELGLRIGTIAGIWKRNKRFAAPGVIRGSKVEYFEQLVSIKGVGRGIDIGRSSILQSQSISATNAKNMHQYLKLLSLSTSSFRSPSLGSVDQIAKYSKKCFLDDLLIGDPGSVSHLK